MFKFIHAADIHLDSPLRGLEAYEGAPVEQIRQATRRAFENLVQLAIDERAAFLLIAGDLYDGDWKDYSTGLYFTRQMARLGEAGIRVYVIAGNHDAANRMTQRLRLPGNVHLFSAEGAETQTLDDCGVAIHGQSFATAAVTDDLSQQYPRKIASLLNIGLLHTCAGGGEGHQAYAPCTVGGLRQREYDYWALGHIHKRQSLCGEAPIHFPGNLQGRHIRETGPKGCLLVESSASHQLSQTFVPLDVFRWELCELDTREARNFDHVINLTAARIDRLASETGGRPLAVRLRYSGHSPAHHEFSANPAKWLNELRSCVIEQSGGEAWLEKVVFDNARGAELDPARLGDGPLADLLKSLNEVQADPAEMEQLMSELDDLRPKLREWMDNQELSNLTDPETLRECLAGAEQLLLSRLLAGKDGAS